VLRSGPRESHKHAAVSGSSWSHVVQPVNLRVRRTLQKECDADQDQP
jgi:hypothetical protein